MNQDIFERQPEVGDIILYLPYNHKSFVVGRITAIVGDKVLMIFNDRSNQVKKYQSEYIIIRRGDRKFVDAETLKAWSTNSRPLTI